MIYSTSAKQRKSVITDIDFGGLVICNQVPNDSIFDQILTSAHQKNTWIKFWDCLDFELPKVRNALIVLNKISPIDLKGILSKEDIQQSFRTNVWLIYIDRKNTSQYFNQNILKIGINAQIFLVESFGGNEFITQVIGKGKHEVEYKVLLKFLIFFVFILFFFQSLGIFNSTVIQESLEQVRRETNFNGINIVSNYAETFPPFGYTDEFGKPKGIFYDVLKIAAQSINLTVIFQKPKKENYNIWLKR